MARWRQAQVGLRRIYPGDPKSIPEKSQQKQQRLPWNTTAIQVAGCTSQPGHRAMVLRQVTDFVCVRVYPRFWAQALVGKNRYL